MTAYEEETLRQMREISTLKAQVKHLERELQETRDLCRKLSAQLSEEQSRRQEYENKYWAQCD